MMIKSCYLQYKIEKYNIIIYIINIKYIIDMKYITDTQTSYIENYIYICM